MKEKNKLSAYEKEILKALIENIGFHTTRETAGFAGISWNTADKYLKKFKEKNWIDYEKRGVREYWKATLPKEAKI